MPDFLGHDGKKYDFDKVTPVHSDNDRKSSGIRKRQEFLGKETKKKEIKPESVIDDPYTEKTIVKKGEDGKTYVFVKKRF